jgi:hypothetical protein
LGIEWSTKHACTRFEQNMHAWPVVDLKLVHVKQTGCPVIYTRRLNSSRSQWPVPLCDSQRRREERARLLGARGRTSRPKTPSEVMRQSRQATGRRASEAVKHGYARKGAYPVSDTYPIRIRSGYGRDTYPRRVRVSLLNWARN